MLHGVWCGVCYMVCGVWCVVCGCLVTRRAHRDDATEPLYSTIVGLSDHAHRQDIAESCVRAGVVRRGTCTRVQCISWIYGVCVCVCVCACGGGTGGDSMSRLDHTHLAAATACSQLGLERLPGGTQRPCILEHLANLASAQYPQQTGH